MARGGYRPGAGRKKTTESAPKIKKSKAKVPADVRKAAKAAKKSPLEYMLDVLNDDAAGAERRDRMAVAAAPFVHPRKEPVGAGKKEEREAAADKAAAGRFAAPPPPKLVVDNR